MWSLAITKTYRNCSREHLHHRFHTLLQNPRYRTQVATQNVVYNQPPHPDFYLGVGMTQPPRPNIARVGGSVSLGQHLPFPAVRPGRPCPA
jgi:hypothetical protein